MFFLISLNHYSYQEHKNTFRAPDTPLIFKQRLDHLHFTKAFTTFWDQRYFVDDNWFVEGTDVMLLEIAGEGTARSAPGGDDTNIDILGRIAKKHNGLIFELEHRYYGESNPTEDTQEGLKYLTINQAMGDILYFIKKMDEQYCSKEIVPGKMCHKWIIAGGSYAGAVAAWISQKHQHAFVATISSSGVVEAVPSLPEFDQQTFQAAGTPCGQAYRMAMREIEESMEHGDQWPKKFLEINEQYYDLQDFYYFLADTSLMVFQYGAWSKMCPALNDVYRNRGNVTLEFLKYIKSHYSYDSYSKQYMLTVHDAQREWQYQTCTEMAYFQPAPAFNNIRSQKVDLAYHIDVCNQVFGLGLDEAKLRAYVQKTNNYFGGYAVYGNETIYTNWWQDIWHDCGLLEPQPNSPNVLYGKCRDCGHCIDLHVSADSDPQELKEVRDKQVEFVERKISEYRK